MENFFTEMSHPLIAPIFIALIGGAIAYVISRAMPAVCRLVSLATSVIVLMLGINILRAPAGISYQWLSVEIASNFSLNVNFVESTLGMVVLLGSAGFAILITFYSYRAMAGQYWEGKFYAYLLWSLAGACIIAVAENLFVLLVGWEAVTLMLYLMVNQGKDNARAGAAKAYGMLGFADACLLLAIGLLAAAGGSASLTLFPEEPTKLGAAPLGATGYIVYCLIMVAALTKAGAIPLHTWIPAVAKDAPTSVMAYLPAAMDKLLGIYLLAMLALRMFTPNWSMQVVMMAIGGITILAAVLMAMMQHNMKKLLAFHAVSQVGYMVMGIGTGTLIGVIGGLFHMINNAIYKSNLFLMSGSVNRAAGTDEIEDMGGLAKTLPITFICGLIAAASISGVPPLNGFASKWLVYQGALGVANHGLGIAMLVVAVFGSALTLASFVKVIYSAFLSPAPEEKVPTKIRESFWMVVPMIVLAGGCVVLGLWPQLALDDVLIPAVSGADLGVSQISVIDGTVETGPIGLWNPTQATGLILLGILIGLLLLGIGVLGSRMRVVRPFYAGEIKPQQANQSFRVPGTELYETIAKLPVIGPLLVQAEGGAMDPYHWSGKYGKGIVETLRAQHTGLISLYVAWCLGGIAAIVIYLLVTGM